MSRRVWILAALAFVVGVVLAKPASEKDLRFIKELVRRDEWLKKDVKKIETAIRDIREIMEMEATGKYVLNDTEKKMASQGRKDLHIYTERIRNDTLEVLALYDIALNKPRYQEPLRRVFGKSLDEVVKVEWFDEEVDAVLSEIAEGYGVEIETRGELELKRTMSLEGEMSLLSILLYIENTYGAKLVYEKGKLYLEPLYKDDPAPGSKKHGDGK